MRVCSNAMWQKSHPPSNWPLVCLDASIKSVLTAEIPEFYSNNEFTIDLNCSFGAFKRIFKSQWPIILQQNQKSMLIIQNYSIYLRNTGTEKVQIARYAGKNCCTTIIRSETWKNITKIITQRNLCRKFFLTFTKPKIFFDVH